LCSEKSKTKEIWRRKVMGLQLQIKIYRNYDRQTTENSKAVQRQWRKARYLKPVALVKTDRLTETQNQGKPGDAKSWV
jgi:hypothetical protein